MGLACGGILDRPFQNNIEILKVGRTPILWSKSYQNGYFFYPILCQFVSIIQDNNSLDSFQLTEVSDFFFLHEFFFLFMYDSVFIYLFFQFTDIFFYVIIQSSVFCSLSH